MNKQVMGQRPRPRVALLGKFSAYELRKFRRLFPTIWHGIKIDELDSSVDYREIDLLIINDDVTYTGDWPEHCHTICFSTFPTMVLPGPIESTSIDLQDRAELGAYVFPETSLEVDRQRRIDLAEVESVRDWPMIRVLSPGVYGVNFRANEDSEEVQLATAGAILLEHNTEKILAVEYMRRQSGLGLAWLPHPKYDKQAWVTIFARKWSEVDLESFPGFGDWASSPQWMVPEEKNLHDQIKMLEDERRRVLLETDQQISELHAQLDELAIAVSSGRRRLITSQGDDLLEEVALVFEEIGFNVVSVDELLEEGQPRREDLRLTDPSDADWEAIVEVRGYNKSSGKTADFQRLARFAGMFEREKHREPDRSYYVINGQLESFPHLRQIPLASAKDDLDEFEQQKGAVIWTLDLFKAITSTEEKDLPSLKESIKGATGRWEWK